MRSVWTAACVKFHHRTINSFGICSPGATISTGSGIVERPGISWPFGPATSNGGRDRPWPAPAAGRLISLLSPSSRHREPATGNGAVGGRFIIPRSAIPLRREKKVLAAFLYILIFPVLLPVVSGDLLWPEGWVGPAESAG